MLRCLPEADRFSEAATRDENDAKPKYWTNTQGLEITEKWREFKLHVNSKWQISDSSWKFLKKEKWADKTAQDNLVFLVDKKITRNN